MAAFATSLLSIVDPHTNSDLSLGLQLGLGVRVGLGLGVGLGRALGSGLGLRIVLGCKVDKIFLSGTFGAHGASCTFGAHGRLGAAPLATN